MKRRTVFLTLGTLMFIGIFLMLCHVGYSDGDDVYFYEYTHQMKLIPYLKWRYETWVGRLAAEALVWVTFRMGIWFWRVVNALMLVLLSGGIFYLAELVSGKRFGIGAFLASAAGYLVMDIMTLGYAAAWVNGSIFYTWSYACGVYALIPLAKRIYAPAGQEAAGAGKERFGGHGAVWGVFSMFFAFPCTIVAAMSIEQMGAVLLVLLFLGTAVIFYRERRLPAAFTLQCCVCLCCFTVLFLAPGNAVRVAEETATWFPAYDTLSTGRHMFLTVQWMLSSFANESRLFFSGLWLCLVLLFWERSKARQNGGRAESIRSMVLSAVSACFFVLSVLPVFGVRGLSDLGIGDLDVTKQITTPPSPDMLTTGNIAALIIWAVMTGTSGWLVWAAAERKTVCLLIWLAGIACEAILWFSPTMYASGARLYYMTDLLYLFLILVLSSGISKKKTKAVFYGVWIFSGICHFLLNFPYQFFL